MEDRTKRRARLILIGGFLLAALAAVGTFVAASGARSEQPAAPTIGVLAAARDIPARTVIAAADLRAVEINADAVPPSALRADGQATVVGKINTVAIATGELIVGSRFTAAEGATFTVFPPSETVVAGQPLAPGTPNYRAMSITVADAAAVGGVLAVGDVVDIMYTLTFDPAKYLVPATGPAAERRAVDFSAKIAIEKVPIIARTLAVYTIRTDATTAERLAYLQASGAQIQLLLRAPLDDRAARTEGATFGPVYQTFNFRVPEKITP